MLIVSSAVLVFSCSLILKENPINTIDIYGGTYYKLMKAVKKENVGEIERIVIENHLTLNYADVSNGVSLLNWCIFNNKNVSFEKL